MRVRATEAGHYGEYYRMAGDVFDISDEKFPTLDEQGKPVTEQVVENGKKVEKVKMWGWFSPAWMEKVDDNEPLTIVQRPKAKHPLEAMKKTPEAPRTLSEAGSMI